MTIVILAGLSRFGTENFFKVLKPMVFWHERVDVGIDGAEQVAVRRGELVRILDE